MHGCAVDRACRYARWATVLAGTGAEAGRRLAACRPSTLAMAVTWRCWRTRLASQCAFLSLVSRATKPQFRSMAADSRCSRDVRLCAENRVKVYQLGTTVGSAQGNRSEAAPGWVDKLFIGLVIYVVVCSVWMLGGFGGERIRHYVGLLADSPACCVAAVVAAAAAYRMAPGAARWGWRCLSFALALYFVGTTIGVNSWLHGQDPFPGIADVFYLAFYPAIFAAVVLLIRAAAVKVRWVQLVLDAMILVVGFGAFFWFLVIRPAASRTEIDVIKNALSQTYIALSCILLLTLGVLLLAGARGPSGRRVPLLLLAGFATMFLGDILWSICPAHCRTSCMSPAICHLPLPGASRCARAPAAPYPVHRIPWRSRCRTQRC